jgi:hypothetical protein
MSTLPRLNYFYGWILSQFDRALCIRDERRHTSFYVRTSALCGVPETATIRRLVLQNLHPIIGKDVSLEKVARFFHQFRFLSSEEDVIQRLEQLKNRHLTVIPFSEKRILKHLRPGDILFKRSEELNKSVRIVQWLIAPFLGIRERDGYEFTHAALYLGNGQIAEATDAQKVSGVRIFDIRDERFTIGQGSKREYLVSRCKDGDLARTAVKIAKELAVNDRVRRHPHRKKLQFAQALCAEAAFLSSAFGPMARFRYCRQYIDDRMNESRSHFLKLKDFFCSYFVGYCYQTAESRRIMPHIIARHDVPRPKWYPGRCLWAAIKSLQHSKKLTQLVQLSFDAKRITPYELRNFVLSRPALFQDACLIKKPRIDL